MLRFLLVSLLALLASTGATADSLHDPLDALLERYVVEERYVRYDAWLASEADRQALADYLAKLQAVDPRSLDRDAELAFWINLYNAVTLDLILDHYPLESIKDLGGVLSSPWGRELLTVNGKALSLDAIENQILRPRFQDPRIHFALNCASLGCPPLASRAYVAKKIESQLDGVTRRVVGDSYWVDLDRCATYGKGSIRLSKIFDWYQDDFGGEQGVRSFLAHYLPGQKLPLQNGGCSLEYSEYDWSLNFPPPEARRE